MNPFTRTRAGSAGERGERGLIEAIARWLGEASPPPPEGIGDDCAVFTPTAGRNILVTTDPIIWGRHFDESVAPEAAAAKLFKRNLSDIAAMGGRPRMAVVSLLLPESTSIEWLERFHHGLQQVSRQYDTPLAGGDVSQTDELLGACMTLIGETAGDRALTRSGAAPGDKILVTGSLGGSILGRHLSFEPRLAEGEWLAGRKEVTACIDISDGLAKDLPAILPPGCEAEIFPGDIPVDSKAASMAAVSRRSPLYHAFCDGEDYELLIAARDNTSDLIEEWERRFATPLTCIGVIREESSESSHLPFRGLPQDLIESLHGYEHFR